MPRRPRMWHADSSVDVEALVGDSNGYIAATRVRTALADLAAKQGAEFERACDPYLRLLLGPTLVRSPPQGPIDRAGGDFADWWGTETSPSLLVQCKGFRVDEEEVGPAQMRQFEQSFAALRGSRVRPRYFVVVHNRDLKRAVDRDRLDAAMRALEHDGVVGRAIVWDRKQMMRRVMAELADLADAIAHEESRSLGRTLRTIGGGPVLTRVPVAAGSIAFASGRAVTRIGDATSDDPVEALRRIEGRVVVVLGGFGQGKTTAAARAATADDSHVIVVPGARLLSSTANTAALMRSLRIHDRLVELLLEAGLDHLSELARVAAERLLLRRADVLPTVVIDGFDEAPMAYRRNGVMNLLNTLADLHCRVVLTMRSEYWLSKQRDFAAGIQVVDEAARFSQVPVLELRRWTPDLAAGYVRSIPESDAEHRGRLDELAALLGRPVGIAELLLRPLFLAMAIDVVALEPLRARTSASLLLQWTNAKLARDVSAPQRWESEGRPGLGHPDEDLVATQLEAHRIARVAARLMLVTEDGTAQLTDEVTWSRLREAAAIPASTSLAAVVDQTLLTPSPSPSPSAFGVLMFAHRAIQEFYLAWDRLDRGDPMSDLPSEVQDWGRQMLTDEEFDGAR